MMQYTIPVSEDENGDMIITFPDELMEQMNWQIGDSLEWSDNEDGTWSLRKL